MSEAPVAEVKRDSLPDDIELPREPKPNPLIYSVTARLLWLYGKLYHRISIRGHKNLPKEGPVLVLSNHASHLDPPMVGMSMMPSRTTFLAKSDLWKSRVLGWYITQLGAFPIRRGAGDRAAIQAAVSVLRAGKRIIVFPEGTRSPDGKLQEAKPGAAMIINLVPDVPIVPARIDGSFEAMGNRSRFPRPHKIVVTFGKPFKIADLENLPTIKKQLYQELGEEIMRRIATATP